VIGREGSRGARSLGSAGRLALGALGGLALLACASNGGDPASDGGGAGAPAALDPPYAARVVSFEPGDGAGFGQASLPEVVLGPPDGKGNEAGSLDVLSLGKSGSIVLGFERALVDGDGPDLLVFENAFWPGGDASAVYAEPGEVSVSEDGETWLTFACDREGDGEGHFAGCAGVTPTLEYDASVQLPLDPSATGGDRFDLADLGLNSANFVRIRDVSDNGEQPTAGFDLDAVGLVNAARMVDEP
jgi:hypothetical protein